MKDTKFKSLTTGKNLDLLDEIQNFVKTYENGKMYISTDSQSKGKKVKYATVIVLHSIDETGRGKGGKVMYKTCTSNRYMFGKSAGKDAVKLGKETDLSIELAIFIRDETNITVDYIDLDYNSDPKYFSNGVLISALGQVKSNGFKPRCKPALATAAADKLVKRGN
jgi:predicted RNase H-related nuclease YkuK (DUF458 family)